MATLPDLPKVEAAIIEQTNAFRATNKLAPTSAQSQLTTAAREYARFLAASTLFTHEADGRRPVDRVKASGYKPCTSAENLALLSRTSGFETGELATMMVEGWIASPGHRKNMVLPHVTQTGVGIAKSAVSQKYIGVQLFGRPDSLSYRFTIDNRSGRSVKYALGSESQTIEPQMLVRHGSCEPHELIFETKPGHILSKAVTAKFEARDGEIYRLTSGKSGEIVVEVARR